MQKLYNYCYKLLETTERKHRKEHQLTTLYKACECASNGRNSSKLSLVLTCSLTSSLILSRSDLKGVSRERENNSWVWVAIIRRRNLSSFLPRELAGLASHFSSSQEIHRLCVDSGTRASELGVYVCGEGELTKNLDLPYPS